MAIRAYAAHEPKGELKPFEYDPGPLGHEEVEIAVSYCGLCHSDLAMLDNDWGVTTYPLVPGHEVVGTVAVVGAGVASVKPGDKVGLGWTAESCLRCRPCLNGDHNLCVRGVATIVGHHGGFAERVRCHWVWAIPLPNELDAAKAGPLFCGGVTVFNPFVQINVLPTQRVGVVGIGGLGHLALQIANKWGCDVVAFTSSASKAAEAKGLGAYSVVNSRDDAAMVRLAGSLDLILVTASAPLNWAAYLATLAPKGRLHFLGAIPEPVVANVLALNFGQKSISGSSVGSPATTMDMLTFCTRHGILPTTETFPLSQVNQALDHLRAGKVHYRIVLQNDLAT